MSPISRFACLAGVTFAPLAFDASLSASEMTGAGAASGAMLLCTARPSVPTKPSNCGAVRDSTFTALAHVSWQDNSANEDGFIVMRGREVSPGRWGWVNVGTAPVNYTSFFDSPGTGTWRYRVKAYNAAGNSPVSNWDDVTFP